ncbi:hypothetical protein D3C79_660450 [compost metagenome]
MHFVATLEFAGGQRQLVVAEGDRLVFATRRTRHARCLAAQHGLDPGHQLVRVERLAQVIVGAQLQALDTAELVALGGEHDDRDLVVLLAQALARRQAILAGQHQVEHHQVEHLTLQQAVHLLGVGHRTGTVALAGEETFQQAAKPRIVVDDENLVTFSGVWRAGHE